MTSSLDPTTSQLSFNAQKENEKGKLRNDLKKQTPRRRHGLTAWRLEATLQLLCTDTGLGRGSYRLPTAFEMADVSSPQRTIAAVAPAPRPALARGPISKHAFQIYLDGCIFSRSEFRAPGVSAFERGLHAHLLPSRVAAAFNAPPSAALSGWHRLPRSQPHPPQGAAPRGGARPAPEEQKTALTQPPP